MYPHPRVGVQYQAVIPALLTNDLIQETKSQAQQRFEQRLKPRPLNVAAAAPPPAKRRRTEVEQLADYPADDRRPTTNPWIDEKAMDTSLLLETVREGQLWCPWRVRDWAELENYLQTARNLLAPGRDEIASSWSWETKLGRADK